MTLIGGLASRALRYVDSRNRKAQGCFAGSKVDLNPECQVPLVVVRSGKDNRIYLHEARTVHNGCRKLFLRRTKRAEQTLIGDDGFNRWQQKRLNRRSDMYLDLHLTTLELCRRDVTAAQYRDAFRRGPELLEAAGWLPAGSTVTVMPEGASTEVLITAMECQLAAAMGKHFNDPKASIYAPSLGAAVGTSSRRLLQQAILERLWLCAMMAKKESTHIPVDTPCRVQLVFEAKTTHVNLLGPMNTRKRSLSVVIQDQASKKTLREYTLVDEPETTWLRETEPPANPTIHA